ncbi:MAG: hypothetical protein ABI575_06095 [Oxalobacteraceae bacterium]
MRQRPAPQHDHEVTHPTVDTELRFAALLYRYLFFDWLFADMTKATNLFERHAAWQHNKKMCRYLPTYLRRWAVITALAIGLGCLFEQMLKINMVAACFFSCSCITLTGMLVISVLWIFLSSPEVS